VRVAALAATLVSLLAAACGYSTGFTLEGSPTVGVEIFGNESQQRDIEAELHGYLTEAVERLVAARVVAPERADLVVRGHVYDYSRRTGIRSQDNVLLETGVHVGVQARLVRRRTAGAADGEREVVLRHITVGDDRGYLTSDARGELDARARALRNIADRIVLDLFGDLAYEASLSAGGSRAEQ
jgi:hypothetical protein